MLIDILNKIVIMLFVLGSLNVIRHTYFIIQSSFLRVKHKMGDKSLLLLGVSLAYIVTMLITGIAI